MTCWADSPCCTSCRTEDTQNTQDSTTVADGGRERNNMSDAARSFDMDSKYPNEWKWQQGRTSYRSFAKNGKAVSHVGRRGLRIHRGEWSRKVEGFREHMTIYGSLKRFARRVRLDCDKEEEPRHAIYGTMLAERKCRERSKERICELSPWLCQVQLDHLPTIRTAWSSLMSCGEVRKGCIGPEQTNADFVDRTFGICEQDALSKSVSCT